MTRLSSQLLTSKWLHWFQQDASIAGMTEQSPTDMHTIPWKMLNKKEKVISEPHFPFQMHIYPVQCNTMSELARLAHSYSTTQGY